MSEHPYKHDATRSASPPPVKTPFFYGWLIVGVACLVTFSEVTFLQPILGVFMLPLQEEFGWSRATIAGAIGLGSVVGAFTSPLVGPIIDKWGGRWVMGATGVVMAASLFLLAGVHSVVFFYVFYITGRAAVVSVMGLAASVTVSNWFIRNRGPAIGVMNAGTRAGQALLPAVVALIIAAFGWRTAFIALGFIVLTLAVLPSLIFVRRRPEDVGLYPDGMPVTGGMPGQSHHLEIDWPARAAIRTKAFWLLTLATSISLMAHSALHLHLVPYMQDKGLPTTVAVSVLSLLSITGGIGGLVGGFVQRRMGARRTLVLSLAGHAAGMIVLANSNSLPLAYGFSIYYGLVNGTTLTLNSMIFATYFGRQSLGSIRGFASPIQLIFNAIGPFLGGLTSDVTGSYFLAFTGFAALYLVAASCMALAAQPSPRPAPTPQPASA